MISKIRYAGWWNILLFLLSSFGIAVLSLLLGIGMFDIQIFFDFFRLPVLLVLNLLPVAIFQLLLLALFNRQWAAFLGTALVVLTASVGDFYKLKFRSEPFVFSDISSVSTAFGVMGSFDMKPNTRILLTVIYVIAGTVFLLFLAKGRLPGAGRVIAGVLGLASAFVLWKTVYTDETLYESRETSSDHVVLNWTQQIQASKGFVYQFLYSIGESYLIAPEGYDEEEAARLLSAYTDADIPAEDRVSILVFQLEAFSDLRTLGISGISDEVYAEYDALREESLHGNLIANVFAGGTVNTERCFLTGSSTLADYRSDSDSYVWYLDSQGYTTVGSHPHYRNFYNRLNINRYLGFTDYWYRENRYEEAVSGLEDPWKSDCVFFPEVTDQFITLLDEGENVFSFNVSMQGHGPYSTDSYDYPETYWQGEEDASDLTRCVLNNYLGSVRETSSYLLQTVRRLEEREEPVILIVYGDHKPWMGDGNVICDELGIDFDPSSEEGFLNHYATEYLVWANPAAGERFPDRFSGQGPACSPGALPGIVFERLGWKGSAFMQYASEVYGVLPVIHTDGFYYENGEYTMTLREENEKLLRQFRCVQYYRQSRFPLPEVS